MHNEDFDCPEKNDYGTEAYFNNDDNIRKSN